MLGLLVLSKLQAPSTVSSFNTMDRWALTRRGDNGLVLSFVVERALLPKVDVQSDRRDFSTLPEVVLQRAASV